VEVSVQMTAPREVVDTSGSTQPRTVSGRCGLARTSSPPFADQHLSVMMVVMMMVMG
jgi:hypothetical protein